MKVFESDSLGGLGEYREALELLEGRGVRDAIRSDICLRAIWDTLDAWNMNQRGARLVSKDEFIRVFRECEESIVGLESVTISDIDSETSAGRLWDTIAQLRLSKTKSQIVAVSKALHQLPPDLVPPIDRGYTAPFFSYHVAQLQENGSVFKYMMPRFAEIARRVNLMQYVGRSEWATNTTKVMDNAIVGFGMVHRRYGPDCCSETPTLWQRS